MKGGWQDRGTRRQQGETIEVRDERTGWSEDRVSGRRDWREKLLVVEPSCDSVSRLTPVRGPVSRTSGRGDMTGTWDWKVRAGDSGGRTLSGLESRGKGGGREGRGLEVGAV